MGQNSPQQISFYSNFASIFRVMRHNSSAYTFLANFSTKGVYQSTNLVKFYVNSRKSEILHFDGLFCSKSCTISAKKVQKSYLTWDWRVMQSLKKKLTCSFKHDIRNLLNFHQPLKSENFTSAGSFCPKYKGLR